MVRSGDGDLDDALHRHSTLDRRRHLRCTSRRGPMLLVHGTNDTPATMNTPGRGPAARGSGGREPRLRAASAEPARAVRRRGPRCRGRRGISCSASTTGLPRWTPPRTAASSPRAVPSATSRPRSSGRSNLVGHSQGGLHALACARARPGRVAHVVLLGAPLHRVRPIGAASRWAHARACAAPSTPCSAHRRASRWSAARPSSGAPIPRPGPVTSSLTSADDWVLRNVDRQLLADRPGWRTCGRTTPSRASDPAREPAGDPDVIALVLDELSRRAYRRPMSVSSAARRKRSVIPRTWAQAGTMSGP